MVYTVTPTSVVRLPLTLKSVMDIKHLMYSIEDDEFDAESFFELLETYPKFYGVRIDNNLVGYAIVTYDKPTRKYYLDSLGILEDFRRKGLAKALLTKIILDQPKLELLVSVSNVAAIKLYQTLGFKKKLFFPKYYGYTGTQDSNAFLMTNYYYGK